jgi:hypothetical protein
MLLAQPFPTDLFIHKSEARILFEKVEGHNGIGGSYSLIHHRAYAPFS